MSHSALTFFHSKQTVVNLQVGHYHFTDLGYADATVLMSDQPQADSVLHHSLSCSTGLKVGLSLLRNDVDCRHFKGAALTVGLPAGQGRAGF